MKIKCIKQFRDKTTAKNIKDQTLIKVNDVLICDDRLAKERIKKGLAVEVVEEIVEATEEVIEEKKPRKRK